MLKEASFCAVGTERGRKINDYRYARFWRRMRARHGLRNILGKHDDVIRSSIGVVFQDGLLDNLHR